jgi:hypothetical protein
MISISLKNDRPFFSHSRVTIDLIEFNTKMDFQVGFTLLGNRTKTPLWSDDGGDVTVVDVVGTLVAVVGPFVVELVGLDKNSLIIIKMIFPLFVLNK